MEPSCWAATTIWIRRRASAQENLNPKIQSALAQFLPDAFPSFPEFVARQQWAGIMDETADGKTIVGQWPDGRNIWVVAGFGGHGLPPALGVGKALAESVMRGQTTAALSALNPSRFKTHFRERALRRKHVDPGRQFAEEVK